MQLPAFAGDGDLLGGRFGLRAARARHELRDRLQVDAIEDGERRLTDDLTVERQQPRRRAVDHRDGAGRVDRHDAGRDAFEDRFDVSPATLDLDVLAFELDRRPLHFATAARELSRHRIERFDERTELVVALRLDALVETARADLARRRGEHLHRSGDPLGHVEAHPRCAHQNHQRHAEEERQIDPGERSLQHAQLVVLLERLAHAARPDRELARQIVGRDDDAGRPAVLAADDGGGMQQIAGGAKRLD